MTETPNGKKPLKNIRYERFVLAYIRHNGNGSAAYREIYPQASGPTSRAQAAMLTARPDVAARIDWLRTQALKREHMGADEVLREMARIARVDAGELVWRPGELDSYGRPTGAGTRKPIHELPEAVRRCIKSVKLDDHGNWELVFWSKDQQLTNIAKHHKLISSDVTVNVQVGFSERLRAAREKRLKGPK